MSSNARAGSSPARSTKREASEAVIIDTIDE